MPGTRPLRLTGRRGFADPMTTREVAATPRHPRFVRITHWLTVVACLALLVSGVEVVLSHPR